MLNYAVYKDFVNKAIGDIRYPESPEGLYQPIAYTLAGGGKRLRSVLVLSVADALGLDCSESINQALGIEIFHNFTLLHDDVMDRADVRRGKPTVHVKWNESTAILSGDAMLTLAGMYMCRCRGEVLPDVMDLYQRTAMEIYEGQQYDMDFEQRNDVSTGEYIHMIRLKTAVLLGCACATGALLAGADAGVRDAFYTYGEQLGLAFQLQDDYLDTYGDPKVFGKAVGGDIMNDKKNYLLAKAYELSDGEQRATLDAYRGSRDPEKIGIYKEVYAATGVKDDCLNLMKEYVDRAVAALDNAGLSPEAKAFFVEIAESSLTRQS